MTSLLQPAPSPVLGGVQAPPPPPVEEAERREFGDSAAARRAIFTKSLSAVRGIKPLTNARHTLALADVDYQGPDRYSLAEQKAAILEGRSLGRKLRGTWRLSDSVTGQAIEEKKTTLATIPYLTDRGTFINNGVEYTLGNQLRLRPGVFTRAKNNGEIEAHVNILPGEGRAHRYHLDPAKGVFYADVGQAKIPLLPLLRALGADDKRLRETWGAELLAANLQNDNPSQLNKFFEKFLKKDDLTKEDSEKKQALIDVMGKMRTDPDVMKRTLGKPYANLGLDAILDTTRKLLAVARKEADVDDRDHLAFQTVHGPEDLIAERFSRDYGGIQRGLFQRASWAGSLKHVSPNALSKQVQAALLHSGLGQALEEINPSDVFDKQSRISRLGEGGIPSLDAVPDEARAVQPSHLAFMDPARTPESFKVGIDVHIARSAMKGSDGKIYSPFTDRRTGQTVYKSPQDVADLTVAFPGEMASAGRRAWALTGGKIRWAKKDEIDLVVPQMENAFSPLGNMIPFKSATKGQRVAMGSRFITQALPLVKPEAPYVQAGVPDSQDDSYEAQYGKHMGALHAKGEGRVMAVNPDSVQIRYADGSTENHDLYQNFPYNRKTYLHQTPTVKPGDMVQSGQTIAHSNYTDKAGVTALGLNARTAYLPYMGKNFEDAIVISRSMAKRLSSEHMYQHRLDKTSDHKLGRGAFLSLFPGKFARRQVETIDKNGIVLPGTEVHEGDPLILGAVAKAPAKNKVHRRGGKSFGDASVVWEHASPGIVTDVVTNDKGTTVLVKSISEMQEGDKLCFDPETSLLTKTGWKLVAEISEDDLLATLNPITEELEWHKPGQLRSYEHSGSMYRLRTKQLDMLVTLDHKHWVRRPGCDWQLVRAEDFFHSRGDWQFKKDCNWTGREQDWYTPSPHIPHTSRDNYFEHVEMDTWLEFAGYYVAEGRACLTTNDGYQVQISQFRSSPAWQDIRDCLDALGLRYTYLENENRFEINSKFLFQLVKSDFGSDAYDKRLPEYVQELSKRQLGIIFDAYMAGDGHRGACWEYGTSSEQLSFDLELVTLKLGWCSRPILIERTDNFQKNPHWRARVNRKHLRPWWSKRHAGQYESNVEEIVDYVGKVYCVTVANHLVYAKRGGKSYWSGNSGRYG